MDVRVLLAIDPGAHPGYGVFDLDSKELVECAHYLPEGFEIFEIVIERPVIYPRSKADPNTIITLAIRAGIQVGQFDLDETKITWLTARQWKGQIPKTTKIADYIIYKNILRVLNSFEKTELARALSQTNQKQGLDIVDAVGLGLVHLGRL